MAAARRLHARVRDIRWRLRLFFRSDGATGSDARPTLASMRTHILLSGRGARVLLVLLGTTAGIFLSRMLHGVVEPRYTVGLFAAMSGIMSIWTNLRTKPPPPIETQRRTAVLSVSQLLLALGCVPRQVGPVLALEILALTALLAAWLRVPRRLFREPQAPDGAA